jgi:hypothetical protein
MSCLSRPGRPFTRPFGQLRRLRLLGLIALACTGCAAPPVDWEPPRVVATLAGGDATLSAEGTLHADTMVALAAAVAPPSGPICAGSLRLAAGRRTLFAIWWAPRPDSGVRLLAARSGDGGRSWSAPAPVDTTDVGATGCRREPAAIAADTTSGYVHATYALQAAEGPGLFFSHSMDGGATFHAPVPILYGERLGRTSVAADGDVVAVAFEDPNSTTPRIGLALSRTMGHIFEHRILPVSDNGIATHPLAAVHGRRIAVAWRSGPSDTPPTSLSVRSGTVR